MRMASKGLEELINAVSSWMIINQSDTNLCCCLKTLFPFQDWWVVPVKVVIASAAGLGLLHFECNLLAYVEFFTIFHLSKRSYRRGLSLIFALKEEKNWKSYWEEEICVTFRLLSVTGIP
ncbi:hypothetical protein C5167_014314 [Papaver somniferum]|uniref:Uncharacterized protein n=1 Tax=Papaver somniferum TaxID=3469 RepID=A0A4Y7J4T7_PAPSO|nr:hypothetical protein C5167_014314 [Papaver somniferum]